MRRESHQWTSTKPARTCGSLRNGWTIKRQPGFIGCSPNLDCRIYVRYHRSSGTRTDALNCWGKKQAYVPRIFSRLGSEGNRKHREQPHRVPDGLRSPAMQGLVRRESPLSGSAVDGNTRERWNIRNPPAIVLAQKLNLEVKLPRLCHLLHCLQIEFTSLAVSNRQRLRRAP